MMDEYRGRKSGFTLVELSIVMVIIGLLIGGILVGQNMIDTARRQEFLKELHAMKFAYENFKESMHAKPGDFSRRVAVLGYGTNGDGDGLIEWDWVENASFWTDLQHSTWPSMTNDFCQNTGYLVRNKNVCDVDNIEFYFGHSGDLYAGWYTDSDIGSEDAISLAIYSGGSVYGAAIRSKILVGIDSKMDDGLPWSGMIRGHNGSTRADISVVTVCNQASGGTRVYKLDEDGPNCRMLYLINRN